MSLSSDRPMLIVFAPKLMVSPAFGPEVKSRVFIFMPTGSFTAWSVSKHQGALATLVTPGVVKFTVSPMYLECLPDAARSVW